MAVRITDTRGRRTTLAEREKRDQEIAAEQTRIRQEHQARNAAALAEEQRVAALTPEQRRAERDARQADALRRHAEANAKAMAGPAENKALAGPPENKAPATGVDFASDEAAELAAAEGLTADAFKNAKPSGKNGFTVADVRGLLEG